MVAPVQGIRQPDDTHHRAPEPPPFSVNFPLNLGHHLELGEPGLAGLAVQEAVVILAVVAADREVAGAAAAVFRAVGVVAAIQREVVRGHGSSRIKQD